MMTVVLIIAAFCFCVGVTVLWANPTRLANQAFAIQSVLLTVWFGFVCLAIRAEHLIKDPAIDGLVWFRANAAIVAFLPWTVALIKESLMGHGVNRLIVFRRTTGWFTAGVLFLPFCFATSFVYRDPLGMYRRGLHYWAACTCILIAYCLLIFQIWRQTRQQSGVRRVEMQFLALNMGFAGLLSVLATAVGNYLQMIPLKHLSLFGHVLAYGLTAWAITYYRIFDAREVFLSLGQRVGLLVAMGAAAIASCRLLEPIAPFPFAVFISVAGVFSVGSWLDRKSRHWFGLTSEQILSDLRYSVINFARTEPNPKGLIQEFQTILRKHSHARTCTLLFEHEHGYSSLNINFSRTHRGYEMLCELGWATPESLHRRRMTHQLADLNDFLRVHTLGLLVTIPRGSPSPSLLVAFGTKDNERPYTYPEILRIQSIAELMDNVLTRSRLTTQADLKAKTEHLAMMSRGLAHDLKNLLTPVSSFLVHTDGRFPPESPEAEVHGAAQRSIKIMGEYVREARFFAEQLTPQFERTSLQRICDGVREVTRARAAARNISIAVSLPDQASAIVDRVLIQRLLANLVANAIDASPTGQTVRLSGKLQQGRLCFQVTDEGSGIPRENLGRIFEAYFTTKEFGEDVRGFGLGLTICQKIAALHGGEIFVESEVGRGSTFTVELPASPPLPTLNCVMLSSGAGI